MRDSYKYFMDMAYVARTRASCIRRKVGAVLVLENHVIATGYNGTPYGVINCVDGGCDRCLGKGEYREGRDYDLCICIHAEQNCILQAAKFGHATKGSVIYSTLQPCLECLKLSIMAGISEVYFHEPWAVPSEQVSIYRELSSKFVKFGSNDNS